MIDTDLRELFADAAAAVEPDDADVQTTIRAGRRRRRLVRASAVAGVFGLVVAAAGLATLAWPSPGLDVADTTAEERGIRIFLCKGELDCAQPDDDQIEEIEATLQADPDVTGYTFRSQQQNYDSLRERYADSPDFIENLTVDGVSAQFTVALTAQADLLDVLARYRTLTGVEQAAAVNPTEADGFVRVPDVVGHPVDQARQQLEERGLTVEVDGTGTKVAEQLLGPHTIPGPLVEPGSTIILVPETP